jgi:hypothetical protein
MMPPRSWKSWFFAALPAALGISCIILAVLPYGTLKLFFDSHLPDGNFNSLKDWNAGVFKVLFLMAGLFFLVLAGLTGLQRWNLIGSLLKQLWLDACHFFAGLRPRRGELGFLAALLVIMLLAVAFRLEYIYSPLHHDEAYTYVAFARSLFAAVTDYHLPNNHIFHSILVYLSTQLFGIQPWAVRLPAFIAGVLLVPAVYWLAKRLYDRWTGLGAALLVAWLPVLINYSTNARGYTLVALFTLLTLTLAGIVLQQKNLFAWMLISLFSALGLYTVPVMLFPFGILFAWLFIQNQVAGPGPYRSKLDFLRYWVAAGFGAAVLAMVLYTPILIFTGPEKVFANGFVAPLPWADLLETLSHRFAETWVEWTSGVPPLIVILLVAGWILSLVFHRRLSHDRFPLQVAALLWIVALIIIQRPNAWGKVWLFLLPLMLLWASAGIVGLLEKVRLKFMRGVPLAVIGIGLALLVGIQHAAWLVPQLPGMWASQRSEEKTVLFVQSQLHADDLIVVSAPDDAVVWYYSELHGIASSHFETQVDFDRLLVLVDPSEGQTPATVIADRDFDPAALDVGSARLLGTFGKMQVFEVKRK